MLNEGESSSFETEGDPGPGPAGEAGGKGDPRPDGGEDRFQAYLAMFKETFEHAPFSVCIFDEEGRFHWGNPSLEKVFGMTPAPPEYCLLEDPILIRHGARERLEDLRAGKPARLPEVWYDVREFGMQYVKGKPACIAGFVFPFKDETGAIRCFFVFHDDATERELAREALEKSEKKYRLLVETAPLGIVSAGREGTITEANPKAVEILGLSSREDALDIDLLEHPVLVEAGIAADVRRCFRTGAPLTAERPFETKLTEKVFLRYLLTPSRVTDGLVEEVQMVLEDITESVQAREAALRSERLAAVGTLAGGIVHDFGNVLSGIVGQAEILARNPKLDGDGKRHVEVIREAGLEARELIKRLKELARESEPAPVRVDVHAVIRAVADLAQYALPKSVRIDLELRAEQSELIGDPVSLHGALLNLAMNAREAMPDGGTLTFASLNEDAGSNPATENPGSGRVLMIRVSDTGPGMDATTCERIFDPFFTTKDGGEGAGFGLATVRHAVQRHGGAISVSSEPGKGTEFALRFPLAD